MKSLFIRNKSRNPKVKAKNEFINNIIYNYGNKDNLKNHSLSAAGYILEGSKMVSKANIINNFISGPLTLDDEVTQFSRGTETFHLYASSNYLDNDKNGKLDGSLVVKNSLGYQVLLILSLHPFLIL